MISDDAYRKVLAKLQLLCSKREYCSRDIYRKALAAAEGDTEAAEKLLDSLKADRFVDDGRYAGAFARYGGLQTVGKTENIARREGR